MNECRLCLAHYNLTSQIGQIYNKGLCEATLQNPSLAVGIQTHPSSLRPPTKPYFLLLKLLLWLFVRDEGEIFGKAERLEAPDDLQKIKNRSWVRENKELFQKGARVSIK